MAVSLYFIQLLLLVVEKAGTLDQIMLVQVVLVVAGLGHFRG